MFLILTCEMHDMKKSHFTLLVLLVLCISFFGTVVYAEECSGSASTFIPAIVSNEYGIETGKLVIVDLKLIPGDGTIYVPTHPTVGVSTQISFNDAVNYAFYKSNKKIDECDVLVKMNHGDIGGYVEGPSGGVAFSVLTYAALNNLTLPSDMVFTGAVDMFGNVLQVGGVYEKMKMAAERGMNHFVSPVNSIQELILTEKIQQEYGIEIFEIERVDEAINFAFYDIAPAKKELRLETKNLSYLVQYNYSGMEDFVDVAKEMIETENQSIDRLPDSIWEYKELKKYYENAITNQKTILEKGYLFSAANDAFLNYIDIESLAVLDRIETINMDEKKKEIASCMATLQDKPKTAGNFEWLVGADIRRGWASIKLQQINSTNYGIADEKYNTYRELMYADAWCTVSSSLRKHASNEGGIIDEKAFKTLAKETLETANALNGTDSDLEFHLKNANALFNEGKYGATIYEAVFVIKTAKAMKELKEMDPKELNAKLNKLQKEHREYFWGKIYHSQGVFVMQGKDSNNATAYRVFKLAEGLDDATKEMEKIALNPTEQIEDKEETCASQNTAIMILTGLLIVSAVLLLYYTVKGTGKTTGWTKRQKAK